MESIISVRIFKSGKTVKYMGKSYTVNYVRISGYRIFVYLNGIQDPVPEHLIEIEPSVFDLKNRNPMDTQST